MTKLHIAQETLLKCSNALPLCWSRAGLPSPPSINWCAHLNRVTSNNFFQTQIKEKYAEELLSQFMNTSLVNNTWLTIGLNALLEKNWMDSWTNGHSSLHVCLLCHFLSILQCSPLSLIFLLSKRYSSNTTYVHFGRVACRCSCLWCEDPTSQPFFPQLGPQPLST